MARWNALEYPGVGGIGLDVEADRDLTAYKWLGGPQGALTTILLWTVVTPSVSFAIMAASVRIGAGIIGHDDR